MIEICLTLLDDKEDKKAFEKLYYSQHKKLYGMAMNILKDSHLAEDAVSETFFYVARRFSRLSAIPPDSIRAYCAVAVKNFSRNIIRSNFREVASEYNDICDDRFITDEELKSIDSIYLKEKIAELKYDYQEILMLYYVYRCSVREIAGLKKLSYNTVKKYLHEARMQLKTLMEADYVKDKL